MWEELLEDYREAWSVVNDICEEYDERYIALDEGPDKSALGMVLTHLKDARSALERAEDAVP